jgi:Protein of unknown function (DUF2905)
VADASATISQVAPLGKSLILIGLALAVFGAAMWALSGVPLIGKLPGDFYVRRGNFTFYFPLATCVLISIVLSLLFALLRR